MTIEKVYDELYGMIEDLKKQIAAGGGDKVTITPALESGTKIADFTIGEDEGFLYAPTPYTPLDYSTDEQELDIVWVDESTIFKKTINFGALPNANAKSVAHGIENLGRVVDIEVAMQSASGCCFFPYGYPTISGKIVNSLYIDSTNIAITVDGDFSAYDAYVTIFYTKTPPTEAKKTKKK